MDYIQSITLVSLLLSNKQVKLVVVIVTLAIVHMQVIGHNHPLLTVTFVTLVTLVINHMLVIVDTFINHRQATVHMQVIKHKQLALPLVTPLVTSVAFHMLVITHTLVQPLVVVAFIALAFVASLVNLTLASDHTQA